MPDSREEIASAGMQAAASDLAALCLRLQSLHDTLPVTAQEKSLQDLDRDQPPAVVKRAAIQNVLTNRLRPAIEELRAAAAYQPEKPMAEPLLDLTVYSEEMQRRLYDLVVEQRFRSQTSSDPDDTWVPSYTPEQAELKVYFEKGRWFTTWRKLEVPESAPEAERWELFRLEEDSDNPGRLVFHEV